MFDNPEKLFIILLIALFIFGPQKLIGLGASMGKAIREFRGHVRDAQDQFHSAVAEAQKTEEAFTTSEPPALPSPEPLAQPAVSDWTQSPQPAATIPEADAGAPPAASTPGSAPAGPAHSAASEASAESAVEDEGPHSLASEPSSQAVLELLQRRT